MEGRRRHTNGDMIRRFNLGPSIHKFDDVFIYSIRLESFDLETLDRLMAEGWLSAK